MKLSIKKYIQYKLQSTSSSLYYNNIDFRGCISGDLEFLSLLLSTMKVKSIIECLEDSECDGLVSNSPCFDIVDDDILITDNLNRPDEGSSDWPHFKMKIDNFEKIVRNWQHYEDELVPIIYLILLSNNEVAVQVSLYENPNLFLLKKIPKYIVERPSVKDNDYTLDFSAPQLRLLRNVIRCQKPIDFLEILKEQNGFLYKKNDVKIEQRGRKIALSDPADNVIQDKTPFIMPLDNFKLMLEEWKKLREKRAPEIYFIQEDDGTIIVRESLKKHKPLK